MKQLINSKWFTEVDKFQGIIKVKADDGAKTPICSISTPAGVVWMENTMWLNNALKKAEIVTQMPELYKLAEELIVKIESNMYKDRTGGHSIDDTQAFKKLKELVIKLS